MRVDLEKYIQRELSNRDFSLDKILSSELREAEFLCEIKNKDFTVLKCNRFEQPNLNTSSIIRLNFINDIIKSSVSEDVNCKFILNLHDSPQDGLDCSRLCLSRKQNQKHICIPDCHLYQARILMQNILEKEFQPIYNKAIFRGSSTGPSVLDGFPQRVVFCKKYKDSEYIDAGISNWVGYNEVSEVTKDYVTPLEQCRYKFIININGNATSWDRLPWIMASNSICIFIEPSLEKHVSWYYPYFEGEMPFLYIKQDEVEIVIENIIKYNLESKVSEILDKQKRFCQFFMSNVHELYLNHLLERYSLIQNKI